MIKKALKKILGFGETLQFARMYRAPKSSTLACL
jgi:hypothetical protein